MQVSNNQSQKSDAKERQMGINQNNKTAAGTQQMQSTETGVPGTEIPGTDTPGPTGPGEIPPDSADTSTVGVEKRDRAAFEKAFGSRGRNSNVVHSGELPESQDRSSEQQG